MRIMKSKLFIIAAATLTLMSCKKDLVCECTTVTYVDGIYSGSSESKENVKSATECTGMNQSSAAEVKTCTLED